MIYDGECSFCIVQVGRIRRWDRGGLFEYVPRQEPDLERRFPGLAVGDLSKGMGLVDSDGRIHVGADAVYQIARRLPVWRRLVWIYRLPVAHGVARLVYRWIAANRQSLGRSYEAGRCEQRDRGG